MWPFGSSSEAGPSKIAQAVQDNAPDSTQSTSQSSTPSSNPASRWERTLADEEAYQAKVYPTTGELPSCMNLLDEFLMCYALGPQLRNMYRHGTYRDCTWKWADFKYCLSLKAEDMEERRELWIKRRAEWWARRRFEGSSEDVWNVRDKPLENFPPLYADEVPAETPM